MLFIKNTFIMKLKNFGLLSIFILLTFAFSSCIDEDYKWLNGWLDKKATFYTSRGIIDDAFRVDVNNIYFENERFDGIEDIKIYGNDEIGLTVRSNHILDRVILNVDGTNADVRVSGVNGHIVGTGRDVEIFMDALIDQIYRYGYAVVNVYGENLRGVSDIQLDIQLFVDLEVYVRY